MAVNQEYKEYRVNDLPETGYAGDRYYLNVGGGKFQTYIISDALTPVREAGQEFIECDTVDDLRNLDARQIWAIQNGYYKGVTLNGYYTKDDTPAPIQYYLSNTTETDNGGSVIQVDDIKLEHTFEKEIDIKYFGAKAVNDFDNTNILHTIFANSGKLNTIYVGDGDYNFTNLIVSNPIRIIFSKNAFFKSIEGSVGTAVRVISPNVHFDSGKFDFNNQNYSRGIRVEDNSSNFTLDNNFIVKNQRSLTFARAINIHPEGCQNFRITSGLIDNIYSEPNATVGDNNGTTRAIYLWENTNVIPVNPSFGYIGDLDITNIQTIEDGDGIHIQSQVNDTNLRVTIQNIRAKNVAKRVIKIQSDNVIVNGINSDSVNNEGNMYSIVSIYGNNCSVSNVFGIGKLTHIIDNQGDGNTINSISGENTSADYGPTATTAGAFLFTKAKNVSASNLFWLNFNRGIAITNDTGAIDNLSINTANGTSQNEALFMRNNVSVSINKMQNISISFNGYCEIFGGLATRSITISPSGQHDVGQNVVDNLDIRNVRLRSFTTSTENITINIRCTNLQLSNILDDTNILRVFKIDGVTRLRAYNIQTPNTTDCSMFIQNSSDVFCDISSYGGTMPVRTDPTVTNHSSCSFGDQTPVGVHRSGLGSTYRKTNGGLGETYFLNETDNQYGQGFAPIQTIRSYTTATRPTVTRVGFRIFNTTLKCPEWWDGSKWVNGTPVATQSEVDDGLDNVKTITSLTLENKLKKGVVTAISTADATDEATAIALANANKAKINEIITKLSTIIFK